MIKTKIAVNFPLGKRSPRAFGSWAWRQVPALAGLLLFSACINPFDIPSRMPGGLEVSGSPEFAVPLGSADSKDYTEDLTSLDKIQGNLGDPDKDKDSLRVYDYPAEAGPDNIQAYLFHKALEETPKDMSDALAFNLNDGMEPELFKVEIARPENATIDLDMPPTSTQSMPLDGLDVEFELQFSSGSGLEKFICAKVGSPPAGGSSKGVTLFVNDPDLDFSEVTMTLITPGSVQTWRNPQYTDGLSYSEHSLTLRAEGYDLSGEYICEGSKLRLGGTLKGANGNDLPSGTRTIILQTQINEYEILVLESKKKTVEYIDLDLSEQAAFVDALWFDRINISLRTARDENVEPPYAYPKDGGNDYTGPYNLTEKIIQLYPINLKDYRDDSPPPPADPVPGAFSEDGGLFWKAPETFNDISELYKGSGVTLTGSLSFVPPGTPGIANPLVPEAAFMPLTAPVPPFNQWYVYGSPAASGQFKSARRKIAITLNPGNPGDNLDNTPSTSTEEGPWSIIKLQHVEVHPTDPYSYLTFVLDPVIEAPLKWTGAYVFPARIDGFGELPKDSFPFDLMEMLDSVSDKMDISRLGFDRVPASLFLTLTDPTFHTTMPPEVLKSLEISIRAFDGEDIASAANIWNFSAYLKNNRSSEADLKIKDPVPTKLDVDKGQAFDAGKVNKDKVYAGELPPAYLEIPLEKALNSNPKPEKLQMEYEITLPWDAKVSLLPPDVDHLAHIYIKPDMVIKAPLDLIIEPEKPDAGYAVLTYRDLSSEDAGDLLQRSAGNAQDFDISRVTLEMEYSNTLGLKDSAYYLILRPGEGEGERPPIPLFTLEEGTDKRHTIDLSPEDLKYPFIPDKVEIRSPLDPGSKKGSLKIKRGKDDVPSGLRMKLRARIKLDLNGFNPLDNNFF